MYPSEIYSSSIIKHIKKNPSIALSDLLKFAQKQGLTKKNEVDMIEELYMNGEIFMDPQANKISINIRQRMQHR